MCLDTITARYEKPIRQVTKAYKQFWCGAANSPVEFKYRVHKGSEKIIFNKWLKAEESSITSNTNEPYTAGFHAYVKEHRLHYDSHVMIWPVYQFEITTRVMENPRSVTVSRYLYIPSDPNAPGPQAPRSHKRKPRVRKED